MSSAPISTNLVVPNLSSLPTSDINNTGNNSGVNLTINPPTVISDSASYYVAEQSIFLEITGLKPSTVHKFYINNQDNSAYCKPFGGQLGDVLMSDAKGTLDFYYFFTSGISNTTSSFAQSQAQINSLIGDKNVWVQNSDNTSFSAISFSPLTSQALGNNFLLPITSYPTNFNTIFQTFYVDPKLFGNSTTCYLTSAAFYVSSMPAPYNNKSGIAYPGLTVAIGGTDTNNNPNTSVIITESAEFVPYANIKVGNAIQVSQAISNYGHISGSNPYATKVTFNQPIPLLTGEYYSLMITPQDPDYTFFHATTGQSLGNTSTQFSQSIFDNYKGAFFNYSAEPDGTRNQDDIISPVLQSQLTFGLGFAKFTANSATYEIVNRDLEFLLTSNQNGVFLGGEYVYQVQSNAAGTAKFANGQTYIIGNGTSFSTTFTPNSFIVVNSSVSGKNPTVRNIVSIANNTYLTVNEPMPYNENGNTYFKAVLGTAYYSNPTANSLILVDSNANSTLHFSTGTTVCGAVSNASAVVSNIVNLIATSYLPEIGVNLPQSGNVSMTQTFAYSNGSNYVVDPAVTQIAQNFKVSNTGSYVGLVLSRSNEIQNSTYLYANNKSSILKVTFNQAGNANNLWTSPYIYSEQLNMYTYQYLINSTYANSTVTGNSTTSYVNTGSTYITTEIHFDPTYQAGDLLVTSTAYIPAGANVLCFAKIYNSSDSDTFEQKQYTQLYPTSNNFGVSTPAANNFLQVSWGLPNSPPSAYTANGTVTTTNGSAVITGQGTNFGTEITANSIVKVWSPLFPQNYIVSSVVSVANTTQLTLSDKISNNSITGYGFKIDLVSQPFTAFTNPQNNGIVRYYNSNYNQVDGYDTLQIKLVLITNALNAVPIVNSLTAVGLST